MAKYLDQEGLLYFWQQLKTKFNNKVDKVSGKDLSTNDYTTTDKNKLEGIESGAEANVLEGISVNGSEAPITNKVADLAVPTKTSELNNDSGFITEDDIPEYTETDPTVPAWAKAATKPTYTASEVGALPASTSIPSKTSDLTNDSGFITSTAVDSTYAKKTDITNMYRHKGSVASVSDLPSTGNTAGDVYNVTATGMNYVWTSEGAWDALGEIFSISTITNSEIDTIVAS